MYVSKQLTPAVRTGLERKVEEHNDKVGNVASKRTNLRTLAAVFRRGVGAYRTNPQSVRPSVRSEEQWAYARVNAFLYALRNGRYRSGRFDQDLLPESHPLSTKAVSKASYKPTQGMVDSARRGLAMRREFGRGGTPVGIARARDIVNGRELSESTVLRMHSFFSRHAVDAEAEGFRSGEDGYPSNGRIAHELWGGDSGRSWSKRIRDQIMRQRNKQMEDTNKEQEVTKAAEAMEHLLMAYNAMIAYSFEDAHQMRADLMELIHSLEHEIAGKPRMEVETGYMDDEDKGYYDDMEKEIVMEDGQFCVRSKDGTRSFGCYISRERAEQRLAQIESFAERLKTLQTINLMEALTETEKAISGQTLPIINELIGVELNKRLSDEVEELTAAPDIGLTTIVKAEQRYTMGPVYVPNLEDAHGETIEPTELQTAIWDWVRKGDRRIFLQHSEKVAGEMVEILTMPMETEMSLTVPNQGVTKYQFPADTPFMGVIWEDWAWDLVKAGKLRGYSIGGQAQRVEVELPDVMV